MAPPRQFYSIDPHPSHLGLLTRIAAFESPDSASSNCLPEDGAEGES